MSRRMMRIAAYGTWWEVKCKDCGDLLPLWGQRSDAEKASRNHRNNAHPAEPITGYGIPRTKSVKPCAVIPYPVEPPLRHRHPFPLRDLPGVGATIARSFKESA